MSHMILRSDGKPGWKSINFEAAQECGAAGSVAKDVLSRLHSEETVLARIDYAHNDWHDTTRFHPVKLCRHPLRPHNNIDSTDAEAPPAEETTYALPDGCVVTAGGGGFSFPHTLLLGSEVGWSLEHYEGQAAALVV